MSGSRTQNWDFGASTDDEASKPDLPREDLVEKTRAATREIGYVGGPVAAQEAPSDRSQDRIANPAPTTGRPRGKRTISLATKITAEQDALLKAIASDGMVIADIVSEAMKALARELAATGRYKKLHLDHETIKKAQAVLKIDK